MPNTAKASSHIDTTTTAVRWYGYNGLIGMASVAMAGLASLILEYELAKLRNPEANFLATPTTLDITLSTVVILLAIANIAVLIFILLRHLWLRKWMIGTTAVGWVLLAILAVVLGERFLQIIAP